jgi:hypothetical protein
VKFIKAFFAKLFAPGITAPGSHFHSLSKGRPTQQEKQKWIKCEECETWYGELTEGEAFASSFVHTENKEELKALYTCGKCRHVSEWFTGAPMPIKYSDVRKVE